MDNVLGPDGPFARMLTNFRVREQQQEMARAVTRALENRDVIVTEAGTGTGKTYAYLVPAILHGGKVMISTGTKTLQDQLFYRDLPTVQKALNSSATTALLKGRSNYLCHYRLEQSEHSGKLDDLELAQISILNDWLTHTTTGDIAQCLDIAENAQIWPQVTSTIDNCIGSDCPRYNKCFVLKARRSAQEADIVVINHHLFFIDLSLKGEGFGELLPNVEAVIFDEAHQILDVARQYFGQSVSSRQISELIKDTEKERLEHIHDDKEIPKKARAVERSIKAMHMVLGESGQRAAWSTLNNKSNIEYALTTVLDDLDDYVSTLKASKDRHPGLERSFQRALEFRKRLAAFNFHEAEQLIEASLPNSVFGNNGPKNIESKNVELANSRPEKAVVDEDANWINWYETHEKRFVLHSTPVDIDEIFRHHLEISHCAWIFTSATLSVGKRFDHFTRELGLENATTERWESPFFYHEQTLLYVPKAMPQPNDRNYSQKVVEAALPLINAISGGTFFLLTSYEAMRQVKIALQGKIRQPILVQGDLPKTSLLAKFRQLGNAVLLGTYSFWEGVDVKGSALSCVIIDKLPFASPGDPVMQAQLNAITQRGGNAFMELQLPQAVLRLKQGVGRLIRDEDDTGVLMICDPRLYNKSYGRTFLRSLPDIPVARDFEQVNAFIAERLSEKLPDKV